MNFYNDNKIQDKLFMEIQVKYNLSYWIASDVDHFVENFPELLSESDFKNLREQYIFALDIFKDANKKAFLLNGRHKRCEQILSQYKQVHPLVQVHPMVLTLFQGHCLQVQRFLQVITIKSIQIQQLILLSL